jgi:hypothetical protein
MDEVLDVAEIVVDSGLEDAFAWILRFLGVVAVLAGIELWLLTEMVWVPAALVLLGLLLLVVPQLLLLVVELAG